MTKVAPMKVRGKLLEIDAPNPAERDWIFTALQAPEVHVPLGCKEAPSRALFDDEILELHRGADCKREPVRFHLLRRRADSQLVGFFLDFGWDHATDSTREIDLAFPNQEDRGIGTYIDATVIIAQYLFGNGLAKRMRWRVDAPASGAPRRGNRQGARLLLERKERHPVTGEWVEKLIYEYAMADFEALGERLGLDPRVDYAEVDRSIVEAYRDPE